MKIEGSPTDIALASAGAISGIWKYYKPELAWGALVAGVVAYDLTCENGSTLSEAFKKQPTAVRVGEVAILGAHLIGIPEKYDVISQTFKRIKRTPV